MADAGGGNFQFIESAAQIADFVASEVGEALATTVREAVLVVDAGEGAVVESLNDFPCRLEDGAWRIAVGSLFSGQALTPVLRVTLPEGETGKTRDVSVRAEDPDRRARRRDGHGPLHLGEPRAKTTGSPATAPSTARWPRFTPPARCATPSRSTGRVTTAARAG